MLKLTQAGIRGPRPVFVVLVVLLLLAVYADRSTVAHRLIGSETTEYRFELPRGPAVLKVVGVRREHGAIQFPSSFAIALVDLDEQRQTYDVTVVKAGKSSLFERQNVDQPIILNLGGAADRCEIVVNEVGTESVRGSIRVPDSIYTRNSELYGFPWWIGARDGNPSKLGKGVFMIGDDVMPPLLISSSRLTWGTLSMEKRSRALVTLRFVVRKDGSCDSFVVMRSVGKSVDVKVIEEIGENWKFESAVVNGVPVDAMINVQVPIEER